MEYLLRVCVLSVFFEPVINRARLIARLLSLLAGLCFQMQARARFNFSAPVRTPRCMMHVILVFIFKHVWLDRNSLAVVVLTRNHY